MVIKSTCSVPMVRTQGHERNPYEVTDLVHRSPVGYGAHRAHAIGG